MYISFNQKKGCAPNMTASFGEHVVVKMAVTLESCDNVWLL